MATTYPADIAALPRNVQASPATLAKACIGAAVAAGGVLTLFVLPAEYGIDPTGIGARLGISGMAVMEEDEDSAPVSTGPAASLVTPTRASIERATAWREDELTLDLPPHSGAEIKAHMLKGDSFVFSWHSTGGPVKVDMHGEPVNAADDEFTSYWKERQSEAGQGDFTATFDGTHGWYWRNKSDAPVKVTVKVAGFYKDLFKP